MRLSGFSVLIVLCGGVAAAATKPAPRLGSGPDALRVIHVPPASAHNRGKPLAIEAKILNPWLAQKVVLFHRRPRSKRYAQAEFRKDRDGAYVALIPESRVDEPGFEYYIASTSKGGATVTHFASAQRPHRVFVRDRSRAARTAARLARHQGTVHEFSLGFSYMNSGVQRRDTSSGERELRDSFNRLDLRYTHRILSDYIYQIRFDFGVLGAKLGAARPKSETEGAQTPGIYFGRATATWEIADLIGFDLGVVLGANQSGFVVGGGGALRLGRLAGTHLEFGFEAIQQTGYDAWIEFAWDTVPRFQMSLRADLTTYPAADDGMTIFPTFNVKWAVLRSTWVSAFVGYGVRFQYQRGGVSAGAAVGYRF